MKNLLLLWIMLAIAIGLMSVNHFQVSPHASVAVSEHLLTNALYVCPVKSGFDSLATALAGHHKALSLVFMFLVLLWASLLLWTFYNSLLKDKFEQKSYKFPIFMGKILLFGFVFVTILNNTPNHYRRVSVTGSTSSWILCESNTPGARAVRSDAVSAVAK